MEKHLTPKMWYTVAEVRVEESDWVAGKSLAELRLPDEGVQVLGIRRQSGEYIGAPSGLTYIRKGDTLVVYGLVKHIAELDCRRAGKSGDMVHEQRVIEQTLNLERSSLDARVPDSEGATTPREPR